MQEKMKTNDLSSLGELKKELEANEPIDTPSGEHGMTPTLLKGTASYKLMKYLSQKYSGKLNENYLRKHPKIIGLLQFLSKENENLSKQEDYSLDNLYMRLIEEIPMTDRGNKGFYRRSASEAGITDEKEIVEMEKILKIYLGRIWDSVLKKEVE